MVSLKFGSQLTQVLDAIDIRMRTLTLRKQTFTSDPEREDASLWYWVAVSSLAGCTRATSSIWQAYLGAVEFAERSDTQHRHKYSTSEVSGKTFRVS